jgi:hypothetical protein
VRRRPIFELQKVLPSIRFNFLLRHFGFAGDPVGHVFEPDAYKHVPHSTTPAEEPEWAEDILPPPPLVAEIKKGR